MLFWPSAAPAAASSRQLFKEADVVLHVTPMRVRPIDRGASVDAVEGDLSRLPFAEAVVSFKVERVMKGQWTTKLGGAGHLDQMSEAVRKKEVLKILTLDFTDPNEQVDKGWISVAVEDPGKTFGINHWDAPETRGLKLYFKRLPDDKDSLILTGVIPLKK